MGDCILADESGRASGELRSVLRGASASSDSTTTTECSAST